MQGRYIGQFLPTSGGTMTGTLGVGGNPINTCSFIYDNQSTPKKRLGTGGPTGAGSTILYDSNGSSQFSVAPGTVNVSGVLAVSNSAAFGSGITQENGAIVFNADGSSTMELGGPATFEQTFRSSSFTAAQLICVDGTNGNDSTGDGTQINPLQTIGAAVAAASSGQCIFVGPGTYTGNFVLPTGVALVGSGRGVTILYATSGVVLTMSNARYVANLTIDSGNASDTTFATCVAIASGTSGTVSGVFENIDFYCAEDGVLLSATGVTGGSLLFRNCNWFTACWSIFDSIGLSIDAYDCNWTYYAFTNRPGGSPQIAAAVCNANNSIFRAFGGNVTVNYAGTAAAFTANAAVLVPGFSNSYAQFIGTNISFNCPNIPSSGVAAPFVQNGSGNSTAVVGPGTVFSGTYQFSTTNGLFGPTLALPTISVPNATQSLAVTSSAVTPALVMNNVLNEAATDAGTLASSTLTINAPSPGTASDGCVLKFRIRNSNSGSTAMTLALNAAYNVGSTSIGTIGAGKRAYLTFVYDGDNSKWDLTSYNNGL